MRPDFEKRWLKHISDQIHMESPFHLETTPEDVFFKASLGGGLESMKQLLNERSMIEATLTYKERPYGLTKMDLINHRTTVIIAAKSDHALIVEYLLKTAQKHDISYNTPIKRDTIPAAISSDNMEVFRKLIGVNPSFVNCDLEYNGWPLNRVMQRWQNAPENSIACIKLLLENGADPNATFGANCGYGKHRELAQLLNQPAKPSKESTSQAPNMHYYFSN